MLLASVSKQSFICFHAKPEQFAIKKEQITKAQAPRSNLSLIWGLEALSKDSYQYFRFFLFLCYRYSSIVQPFMSVHMKHVNSCWNIYPNLLVQLQTLKEKPQREQRLCSSKVLKLLLNFM